MDKSRASPGLKKMSIKALELSLPAPIALPLARLNAAAPATDKLIAMADAVEAVLRYLAYLTAADLFSADPDAPELGMILSERFHQAAQLGSWEAAFQQHVEGLGRYKPFLPEVVEVAKDPNFEKLLGKIRQRRNQKLHRAGSAGRHSGESEAILADARPSFLLLLDRLSVPGRLRGRRRPPRRSRWGRTVSRRSGSGGPTAAAAGGSCTGTPPSGKRSPRTCRCSARATARRCSASGRSSTSSSSRP